MKKGAKNDVGTFTLAQASRERQNKGRVHFKSMMVISSLSISPELSMRRGS